MTTAQNKNKARKNGRKRQQRSVDAFQTRLSSTRQFKHTPTKRVHQQQAWRLQVVFFFFKTNEKAAYKHIATMTNKMRNQGKKTEEKVNTTGLSLWAVHVLARLLLFFEVKLHMCASDLM